MDLSSLLDVQRPVSYTHLDVYKRQNLQSSTLKFDESGEPLHVQQAAQIRAFRTAWAEAGHSRPARVSVSRSIFPLINDLDRAYFGSDEEQTDQIGFLDSSTRAVFGLSLIHI